MERITIEVTREEVQLLYYALDVAGDSCGDAELTEQLRTLQEKMQRVQKFLRAKEQEPC